MVDDPCFERVLRSIAAFHTSNGPGAVYTTAYELRDSVLYEVNPCLLPLHAQQGLGGRGVIRARLRKRDGLPKPQLFVFRQHRSIALAPDAEGAGTIAASANGHGAAGTIAPAVTTNADAARTAAKTAATIARIASQDSRQDTCRDLHPERRRLFSQAEHPSQRL
jgi:hypothetical protein